MRNAPTGAEKASNNAEKRVENRKSETRPMRNSKQLSQKFSCYGRLDVIAKMHIFSFSEIKHLHIVNRNLNSRRVMPADANHILTARLYSPPVTCKPFKSSFDMNDGNLRVPF